MQGVTSPKQLNHVINTQTRLNSVTLHKIYIQFHQYNNMQRIRMWKQYTAATTLWMTLGSPRHAALSLAGWWRYPSINNILWCRSVQRRDYESRMATLKMLGVRQRLANPMSDTLADRSNTEWHALTAEAGKHPCCEGAMVHRTPRIFHTHTQALEGVRSKY